MTVTLKDIALAAKSDSGTVSRILRNHPKAQELRPETRERIIRIAKELGYQRNLIASQTRTGIVNIIAVIGRFSLAQKWHTEAEILSGIVRESSCANYSIRVYPDDDLHATFEEILGNRIRYVISMSTEKQERDQTALYCREHDLKLIFIYEKSHHSFPAVTIDNTAAARDAVLHLAENGHRRIALLCVPHRYHYVTDRHEGYLQGLREAGLDPDPALIDCSDCPEHAAERMLSLPASRRPTAVFGIADHLLIRFQNTALKMGFRIPADLSSFGFGNEPLGQYAYAPLNTVHEAFYERGGYAVRLLLGGDIGILPDASGNYLLPYQLILRNSVTGNEPSNTNDKSIQKGRI